MEIEKIKEDKEKAIKAHSKYVWGKVIGIAIPCIALMSINAMDATTIYRYSALLWILILVPGFFAVVMFMLDYSNKITINNCDKMLRDEYARLEKEEDYAFNDILFDCGVKKHILLNNGYNIGVDESNFYVWNEYLNKSAYIYAYNNKEGEEAKQDFLDTFSDVTISKDDIMFYSKEGDVQYTTKVSGGGGGGSSLSGALIGGLIAGDTGAIIGSRKKVDPIFSTTQTHDSRFTVLRYKKDGTFAEQKFPGFETYDFLLNVLPEKDLIYLQVSNTKTSEQRSEENTIETKLITIKNLLDKGLISEEEYNQKRKQLLKNL